MAAFSMRPRAVTREKRDESIAPEYVVGALGLVAFPVAGLLCTFLVISGSAFLVVAGFALALYGLALVR